MAQVLGFKAMGAVAIKKGDTLDHTKLPTGVTVMRLARGVRLFSPSGEELPYRGAIVKVSETGLTYPLPNVPTFWKVDVTTIIDDKTSYTFETDCLITYGKEVPL